MKLDEREGKDSASSIERRMLCPGSYHAEKDIPDKSTEDSRTGDRIHAAWAGEIDPEVLNEKEYLTYEDGIGLREHVIRNVLDFPIDQARVLKEERLWKKSGKRKVYSGRPDLIAVHDRRALVLDYKALYLGAQEAGDNWQLRALAVLLSELVDVEKVDVAIIQPNCQPRYSVATYTKESVADADKTILKGLTRSRRKDAKRIAGLQQCRYCKARLGCTTCNEYADVSYLQPSRWSLQPAAVEEIAPRLKLAKKIISDCEDEIKRMHAVAAGCERDGKIDWNAYNFEEQPVIAAGVSMRQGKVRQTLDIARVHKNASESNLLDSEDIIGCCSMSKEKLAEKIRAKTNLKGKALKEKVAQVIDGAVTESRDRPSLNLNAKSVES
jgi:hypothetical protein